MPVLQQILLDENLEFLRVYILDELMLDLFESLVLQKKLAKFSLIFARELGALWLANHKYFASFVLFANIKVCAHSCTYIKHIL